MENEARPCSRYVTQPGVQQATALARVLMDSWYAAQKLMALIEQLGKIYYCPLKRNRLVDDSGGVEKYKQIEQLSWSREERKQGKLIKIKNFPSDKR